MAILVAGVALLGSKAMAQTSTGWRGDGATNVWSDAANWDNGVPGGNVRNLFFGNGWVGNPGGNNSLTANNDIVGYAGFRITFEDTSLAVDPSFTITGNGFTLFDFFNGSTQAPRIQNDSTSLQTFNLSGTLTLSNSVTTFAEINPVNGDLLFSATTGIDLAGNTQLRIFGNNGKTVTFNGAISSSGNGGANSVAINQNSTVVFGAANTYTGDTFINAGKLQFAQGSSSASAFLRLGDTTGGASAELSITDADGGTTVAGGINVRSGSSGAKTIGATNTSGTNTFSGSVFLDADVATSTATGGTLAFTGTTFDLKNQTLTIGGTGATAIGGALQNSTGSGKLTKNDNGTLLLTGTNTYSGATTINGGTLTVSGGAAISDSSAVVLANTAGAILNLAGSETIGSLTGGGASGGDVSLNGNTLTVGADNTSPAAFAGTIGGAGGLTKTGTGALTLTGTGPNTYSGTTTITNGTTFLGKTGGAVAISGPVTLGTGSNTINPNLRMSADNQFAGGVTMTFVNLIGGYTRFDLQGTSQTLGGIQDTIGAGVIQNERLGGGGTAAAGTLTISNTANFSFNGFLRDEDDGGHVFKLSLVKSGAGTQILAGGNITFQGTTTINDGKLTLQDTTAIGSAITVNAGGALSAVRTTLGGGGRFPIMANAVTLAGGTLSIDNAGAGLGGGWTTFNAANGLTGSGTININTGVFSRDNTVANAINTSATVNVAAGAFFGAGRGGNSTIGGLNGAGVVSTLWGGTSAGSITIGNGDGSGSFSGTLDGNGTNGADLTQQGGVLSVIKTGGGTQTLTGANTYGGTTTVNGGSLIIQNLASGSNNGNLPGGKVFTTSTLTIAGGATVLVDLGATSLASTNSGLTISGAGTLRKNGVGTWWLGNAVGGTAISMAAGGLIDIEGGVFKNDYANANWSGNSGDLNIATGASVDMRNNAVRVGALTGGGLLDNGYVSAQTLTVGAGGAGGTFTGNVKQTGGGALSVTKIGAGTQTLSGAATSYSGTTTVSQGTLVLDGTNLVTASPWSIAAGANLTINYANTAEDTWVSGGAITGTGTLTKTGPGWFLFRDAAPANFQGTILVVGGRFGNGFNTTVWTNSKADVYVAGGAELDLRTDDIIVDELNGSGTVINTYSLGETNNTLTVGSNNGSSQFDGVIRGIGGVGANNTSIDIGQNSLAKIGTGTFTVTGASVYGGATTVSNGILRIGGGSDRLPVGTTLTVNGGATFGGTFDLNGLNQTVAGIGGSAGAVAGGITSTTGPALLTANVAGANLFTTAANIVDGGANAVSLTKTGTGTQGLAGANTYSGATLISAGALRHGSATAFSPNSNLQLSGGVIEAGFGPLSLNTGTGGGAVQWLTDGGFAAAGAARDITLNGGAPLTWSVSNFVGDGVKLLFGSATGDNTATLTNDVDLGGANRTVEIVPGPAAVEGALGGTISNGTLTVRGTNGTLALTGQATADVVVDNTVTGSTNFMSLLLNRAGGNAIAGGLQIGATDNGQFATVRLGSSEQIADTSTVSFGAIGGSWSYFNLYGFDETIAGLSSLPGKDGGVVQLVEADASPATNSTLTLNVPIGTQSYFGHARDRGSGASTDPGGNGRLGFVKEGAGTQEITTWNAQVWTGPTAVNNGTLRIALGGAVTGNATLSSSTNIVPGATLDFTNAANGNMWTYDGALSGAGTLVKSGAGIVVLTGAGLANSGTTTVNSGILRLLDTTYASATTVNAGAYVEEFRSAGSGGLTANISGAGGFIKNGDGETTVTSALGTAETVVRRGTLTLTGDNLLPATGTVAVSGHITPTLKLNGTAQTIGGLAASRDVNAHVVGGSAVTSALDVNIGAGQQTVFGGTLGGTGTDEDNVLLNKSGAGTLVLNGASTHTGGTIISAGTLQLGASTTMPVNLAALGIWLDGADPDANGIAPADGTPISIWKNKGALGATGDFSAAGGFEPSYGATGAGLMNGNATIRFTADAVPGFNAQANYDKLTNPIDLGVGPGTIIVAGRYAGASADERKRLVSALNNNWLLGWWNNGENTAYYQNGFAPGTSAPSTDAHVYSAVMRGDGIGETYSESAKLGSLGNAVGPNGLALGGGANYATPFIENSTGDVGELIIVKGLLTDADRAAIEAYLARKWTGFVPTNPLPITGAVTLTDTGATLAVNGVTQTVGSINGVAGSSITLGGGNLSAGNDGGTSAFAGEIAGPGTLAKVGVGAWTLSGALSMTTLIADEGTLNVDSNAANADVIVNAIANFNVDQTLNSLDIADGAIATVDGPAMAPPPAPFSGGEFAAVAAGGSLSVGAVPEPGSAALIFGGMLTLLGLRRRKAHQARQTERRALG